MVKKLIVSLPIHCTMETLMPLLRILTLKAPDPHSAAYIYLFILPSRPASGPNLPTFFRSSLSNKNKKKIAVYALVA